MDNEFLLYSVFDTMAKRFGPIFEAVTDEVAARQFIKMMDKVDVRFQPEYELFRVAKFNNVSGLVLPEVHPERVFVAYYMQEEAKLDKLAYYMKEEADDKLEKERIHLATVNKKGEVL